MYLDVMSVRRRLNMLSFQKAERAVTKGNQIAVLFIAHNLLSSLRFMRVVFSRCHAS